MGSFIEDTANKVEIIMLDEEKGKFLECTQFEHEYPPSKIMWIPDQVRLLSSLNNKEKPTQRPDSYIWGVPEDMAGRRRNQECHTLKQTFKCKQPF